MLLTVSKRLEFSASRRLFVSRWTSDENLAAFGAETNARYGTGRNYIAYFIFSGRVDPVTGMLINISEIKRRAGQVVDDRFDHKFLNEDNPAFRELPPTAENIARQLFADVAPLFADVDAKLVACHLIETPDRSATFYAGGECEANYWFEFSAARQTMSPRLTPAENERVFGAAAALHGHNYRARLTFRKEKADRPIVQQQDLDACIDPLRQELDHRHLNEDVPGLKDRPITTEGLAAYIRERVAAQFQFIESVCTNAQISSLKLGLTGTYFSERRCVLALPIDCTFHRFPMKKTRPCLGNATTRAGTAIFIWLKRRLAEITMNEAELFTISLHFEKR